MDPRGAGQTLEHERLRMRREELERLAAQAGRRIEEFAAVRTEGGINLQEIEHKMFRLRGELAAIGEIDEALLNEAKTTEERYAFLTKESGDLSKAVADLRQLIKDLNEKIGTQFSGALNKINGEFQKFFELMFGGGTAKLRLEKKEVKKMEVGDDLDEAEASSTEAEDIEENKELGIEIAVSLPRKRVSTLDALSGGERSLVGIATLFALISVSPPPFLVLDEIDAPLDERNARRFAEMLKEFSKETQFIIVTHNRATMEAAEVLYGVTLDADGTSKLLSIKFEEAAVKN
jgi:chromosome segregation protein